jgi:hypothetical protein
MIQVKERVRDNQPIDLTIVLKDYEGKWVVLSSDYTRVLYSADTIEEIGGHSEKGTVMKIPRFDVAFSPVLKY